MWRSSKFLNIVETYRAASSSGEIPIPALKRFTKKDYENYIKYPQCVLGKGSFGKVILLDSTSRLCLKKIDQTKISAKDLKGERKVLNYLINNDISHTNILKVYYNRDNYTIMETLFYTSFPDTNHYHMDLYEMLKKTQNHKQVQLLILKHKIIPQLCNGVDFLHSHNIYHRDIKPENLVLMGDPLSTLTLKIIDYNLALIYTPGENPSDITEPGDIGTPIYMSIKCEAFNKLNSDQIDKITYYLRASDYWSVIITIYHLLFNNILWSSVKKEEYSDFIRNKKFNDNDSHSLFIQSFKYDLVHDLELLLYSLITQDKYLSSDHSMFLTLWSFIHKQISQLGDSIKIRNVLGITM